MPGGHEPPPAPGVARALAAMFDSIAASSVDVISQHAFDVPAFELARDMPVLHTLHLPPIVASVARVVGAVSPSRLATVSASCLAEWRAAGVDVGQGLPNGVPAASVAALDRAIGQCLELGRAAVRASAVRRLGLDAALDRYEAALLRASR